MRTFKHMYTLSSHFIMVVSFFLFIFFSCAVIHQAALLSACCVLGTAVGAVGDIASFRKTSLSLTACVRTLEGREKERVNGHV